jgi:hypothetical protein
MGQTVTKPSGRAQSAVRPKTTIQLIATPPQLPPPPKLRAIHLQKTAILDIPQIPAEDFRFISAKTLIETSMVKLAVLSSQQVLWIPAKAIVPLTSKQIQRLPISVMIHISSDVHAAIKGTSAGEEIDEAIIRHLLAEENRRFGAYWALSQ